jgi:hypothetical protein
MAFVPTVPSFVPVSYGQGYGNWQQYAGFSKDQPFGATRELLPAKKPPTTPALAPVEDVAAVPVAPPIAAAVPPGPMGSNPATAMGVQPVNPLGVQTEDEMKKAVLSHFGG